MSECVVNKPLLVAEKYADERRFNPDAFSSVPCVLSIRDNDTMARNSSVIFLSSLAEHSITLTLCVCVCVNACFE